MFHIPCVRIRNRFETTQVVVKGSECVGVFPSRALYSFQREWVIGCKPA